MSWEYSKDIKTFSYTCGYCGEYIASNKGYKSSHGNYGLSYICHNCHKP